MPVRTSYNMSQMLTRPRTHKGDKLSAMASKVYAVNNTVQPKYKKNVIKTTGGK